MSDKRNDPGPAPAAAAFEARLRAARERHGLDPAHAATKPAKTQAGALGAGLRVGVELVAALIVATGIGWELDKHLGTMPLMICLFVLLGGAAGILNVWRAMRPTNERERI